MIEMELLNYGMAGIFISYLIYDKQVIMKGMMRTFEKLCIRIDQLNDNFLRHPQHL